MVPTFAFGMGVPSEWLIIAGVVVLLFGGAKISQFGKGLGEGIREFKKSLNGEDTPPPPAVTTNTPASQDVPKETVSSGK